MKIVPLVRPFAAALFCVLLVGCKSYDIDEYELKRAKLYDAALTLCVEAQETSYWNSVDADTRNIVETYRVPSLEIVLRAVWQMDHDPETCLADGFDEILYEYDEALEEYNEYLETNNLK